MSAGDCSYTAEQYLAQLKKLGLTPSKYITKTHTIYITADNDTQPVPNPDWQTSEQRYETIQRLKDLLGIRDD
jgi:hypothetical protein